MPDPGRLQNENKCQVKYVPQDCEHDCRVDLPEDQARRFT